MEKTVQCWCGNNRMLPFSQEYALCNNCESLVAIPLDKQKSTEAFDAESNVYDKKYWTSYLEKSLGQTGIHERSRADLPERCLYWLRYVLKHKLPPGRALEIGSAHGGFVALLRWAGFEATGLDLSPWMVEFARKTFEVPILLGLLEEQQIEKESLDLIVLMDVLEHFPDPVAAINRCLTLLKADGIIAIQTPKYPEGETFDKMKAETNRFLEQLKPVEHQYLFSRKSIRKFFKRLGTNHVNFERAIYNYYDMFLFASRQPVKENSTKKIHKILSAQPQSRLILAFLDADDRYRLLAKQHENLACDHSSRLEVIQQQGEQISILEAEVDRWLEQSKKLQEERNVLETERNELQFRIKDLTHQFEKVEKDREDRLKVIQQQGKRTSILEAEVDRWLEQSKKLQEERNQQDERISSLETELNRWIESRIYYFLRLLNLDRIFLKKKSVIQKQPEIKRLRNSGKKSIDSFQKEIDHFNESQSNKELLNEIRTFNHQIIDNLNSIVPLNGALLLDIGASPHGYALERALYHNVSLYVGIGLDIKKAEHVIGDSNNNGLLINMDATSLKFPDDMFDAVISASTFEHIHSVSKALTEIHRILKTRGYALITFEPIWSYSRGHHLHHFGECSELIPPWAHLEWTPEQMNRFLADKWPIKSAIPLEKAIDWIYHGQDLNRLNIQEFRNLFENCPLKIEWIVNLKDNKERYSTATLKKISDITGLSPDDLTTKGFSVLLVKES